MYAVGLFIQSTPASNSPFLSAIVMLSIGVLAVIIGFLLGYLFIGWRIERLPREMAVGGGRAQAAGGGAQPPQPPQPPQPRPPRHGTMVCPACHREYEFGVRFCPHDSKQLVPEGEKTRSAAGGICPTCKRAFEAGVKFCPHDAEELMPMAFWEATRGRVRPAGVIGKICPSCNAKYDLEATFCGKDGAELVSVN
jgi:predicted amidophosphoribosyltransferase